MPNPKSSGTGYVFYLNLVNTRGKDKALAYFDALAENLSGAGFTSSGSGPIKALGLGEAAVGLCMTWQAVDAINNGSDYEILYFDEGAPYNTYSSAIISGKETDADIRKVFEYIVTTSLPRTRSFSPPNRYTKTKHSPSKISPRTFATPIRPEWKIQKLRTICWTHGNTENRRTYKIL